MKVIDAETSSKTYLFKGKHCFPLSPAANDDDDETVKDQMAIILNKSGKMSEHDMSFVRSVDALDYIKGLNIGPEKQHTMVDKMKNMSNELRWLIKGML